MKWEFSNWKQLASMAMAVSIAFAVASEARSTTMTTFNVTATADAMIAENYSGTGGTVTTNSDTPFGTGDSFTLRTRTSTSTPRHEAVIIRFPLADLIAIVNAGGSIDDVDLKVTPASSSTEARFRGYGLRESLDADKVTLAPWADASVTYNSAPGLFPDELDPADEASDPGHDTYDMVADGVTDSTGILTTAFGSQLLGVGTYVPNASLIYGDMSGFTEFVQQAVADGDESFTLIVHGSRGSSASSPRFHTLEATVAEQAGGGYAVNDPIPVDFAPQLVVTATLVPEPSAWLLAIIGSVVGGILRRRGPM